MISLKRIYNNIVTTAPYPVGVKKFSKWHNKISKSYDAMLGEEPKFDNTSTEYTAIYKFRETQYKLMSMNLWTGANISRKTVGKHKIPRFLYHITTKDNYNKMMQDGYIQISKSCTRGQGLYLFEMQNMIKHYKDFDGERNLGRLLNQVIANSGNEAVLLRIPVSILDAGKLAIRSNAGPGRNGMKSSIKAALGDSALASHLYKQRKVALEYIYPNQLPMDNISVVGSARFKDTDLDDIDENRALELWKELTKHQPEQKGVLNHIFKKETYRDFISPIKKRKNNDAKFTDVNGDIVQIRKSDLR